MPPEARAQIGLWLLRCPFAHPVWSQWVLSLVHLRAVEGMPAAVGHCSHELAIFAVDPCVELEPDEAVPARSLLSPPIAIDFYARDDIRAVHRIEALLEMVMRRQLSPDDDCRRQWEVLLDNPGVDV